MSRVTRTIGIVLLLMCIGRFAPSAQALEDDSFAFYPACGPICVAVVSELFGRDYSLRVLIDTNLGDPWSMLDIRDSLNGAGFITEYVRQPLRYLIDEYPSRPKVVYLEQEDVGHFVVMMPSDPETVFDPDTGALRPYIELGMNLDEVYHGLVVHNGPVEATPPKIQVSKLRQELPPTPPGRTLRTEFEIKNIGTSHVRFTEVKTTCGCTLASLTKRHLAPFETSECILEIDVDSDHELGPISHEAYVYMENVRTPLKLSVRFEVRQAILVEPTEFNTGSLTQAKPLVLSFDLRRDADIVATTWNDIEETLQIRNSDMFEIESFTLEPGTEPLEARLELTAQVVEGAREGFFSSALELHTASGPLCTLQIKGEFRKILELSANNLVLSSGRPDSKSATVQLSFGDGVPRPINCVSVNGHTRIETSKSANGLGFDITMFSSDSEANRTIIRDLVKVRCPSINEEATIYVAIK